MKKRMFRENEIVIYAPKDIEGNIYKFQLGKFKRFAESPTHAFIYFHSGSTAARCDIADVYHLEGKEYIIKDDFNSLDKGENQYETDRR